MISRTASVNTRRAIARWAGGAFAVAFAAVVLVLAVEEGSSGAATVLIGAVDGENLMTYAMFIALLALTVAIWSIRVPRWLLPFTIIAGIAGVAASTLAAGAVFLRSDMSVTALLHRGCGTGYVAVERSFLFLSSGTIYRNDGGIVVTPVGSSAGDDGYKPFASGTYVLTQEKEDWLVHYAIDSSNTSSGRPITLPMLTDPAEVCE